LRAIAQGEAGKVCALMRRHLDPQRLQRTVSINPCFVVGTKLIDPETGAALPGQTWDMDASPVLNAMPGAEQMCEIIRMSSEMLDGLEPNELLMVLRGQKRADVRPEVDSLIGQFRNYRLLCLERTRTASGVGANRHRRAHRQPRQRAPSHISSSVVSLSPSHPLRIPSYAAQ
jgi:hypothetical protein